MSCLKIFPKHFLLLPLLLMAGCVSQDADTDMESRENSKSPVVLDLDQNVPANSTSETDSSVLLTESEKAEPVAIVSVPSVQQKAIELIAETVDWTAPEKDKPYSELLLPEVRIREKKKELIIIPPLFHFYEMGPQEGEVFSFTEPEIIIETVQDRDLLPAASQHTEIVSEEASKKIIVNETQMSVIVRSELDIKLSGRGWIYLAEKETSGIEYVGRHFSADSTVYTFLPELVGTVVLRFQFQDLVNNKHIIEKINLSVLPGESDIGRELVSAPIEVELLEKNDSIALEESLLILLDKNDIRGLSEIAPSLVESTSPAIRKQIPEIAEILFSSSYFVQSAFILEEFLKDQTLYISIDRLLFLLGKIYEEDSSIRNEHSSAAYYKKLIDGYPASIYWDESQDRYRFLKRRYIDIR